MNDEKKPNYGGRKMIETPPGLSIGLNVQTNPTHRKIEIESLAQKP